MQPVSNIQTSDPDEFTEIIRTVRPGSRIRAINRGDFSAGVRFSPLKNAGLFRVDLKNVITHLDPSSDHVTISIPLDRPIHIECEGRLRPFEPGSAHILNAGEEFHLVDPGAHMVLVLNTAAASIERCVAQLNGGEVSGKAEFAPRLSLETREGQGFWRLATFLWNEFEQNSALLDSPFLVDELEKSLLAALVLAGDARDPALLGSNGQDRSPAYLRRAEEFMHEAAAESLSLAEVAAAAGVNARTLTRAFQKKHGKSPMAFLREVRLQCAQMALLAASPRGTTVTKIAMDHGFYQLSHFAAAYRRMFQESPSETLRR